MPPPLPGAEEYDVGWICALHIEYVVACAMLDFEHRIPQLSGDDPNAYTCGKIGDHLVVIACLPKGQYGLSSAASVAADMVRSFPRTTTRLMVGIAGGAPSKDHDIRLGDIVVGTPTGSHGGVIHYEAGKAIQDQPFTQTGFLNAPPRHVLNAVQRLHAIHERNGHSINQVLETMFEQYPRLLRNYAVPKGVKDVLFKSGFLHTKAAAGSCSLCITKPDSTINRCDRTEVQDHPMIHYGTIASADKLMKDAERRDLLAESMGIQCFEMEAAGLMNSFACIVIRGICDYSDTHKNDIWQGYAAATAAAYAKELLQSMPFSLSQTSQELMPTSSTSDSLGNRKRRHPDDQQTDEIVRDTFQFRGMDDREYHIGDAEAGTFQWVVNGYRVNKAHTFGKERDLNSTINDPIGLLEWLESGQGVFRIVGKPGCGKSTLMRFLASDKTCTKAIRSWTGSSKLLVTKYFAWRAGNAMQNTLMGFIRSVLHQVFKQDSHVVDSVFSQNEKDQSIRNHQSRFEKNPEQWSNDELNRFWTKFLGLEEYKMCIFLDGLDEFVEKPDVMVRFFRQIASLNSSWVKVVISGRPDFYFDDFIVPSVRIQLHDWTRDDIEALARHTLEKSPLVADASHITPKEFDNLIRQIVWRADGVFIWVKTVIDLLLEGIHQADTLQELFRKLYALPADMTELYSSILGRLSKEKLAEVITYLHFITELNSTDARDRILVLVLAVDYKTEDDDWLVKATQISYSELERKSQKLRRRVLSLCSHFLSVVDPHMNSLEGQRFEYIHRTAYDFLSSKEADVIFQGVDVRAQDYCSIVFLAELAYETICFRGVRNIPDPPDAICLLDALTNVNGDWNGEYIDPWLNDLDHRCNYSINNKLQFWTALSTWIRDAPPPKALWNFGSESGSPAWWLVGLIKYRLEINGTANKDYLCLMTLALVGINTFGHEAHFENLSTPQRLDIFTADLIGRMSQNHVRPKLKDLLDRCGPAGSGDKSLFTHVLWYRILFCCKWMVTLSRSFEHSHSFIEDATFWTRTALEWMSTLVGAGANANQIFKWKDMYTSEEEEVSALSVLSQLKDELHLLEHDHSIYEEYMPAIRQTWQELENEMTRKGARLHVCSPATVKSEVPQHWHFIGPDVIVGMPKFDFLRVLRMHFTNS